MGFMKTELPSFFMKKTCMVIETFGRRFEGVGKGNGGISIVAGNCRVRESKGVGTLRVLWYFYPCWREMEGCEHYQKRHTECAYTFY